MQAQSLVRVFKAKVTTLFPGCRGLPPVRVLGKQISPIWAKDSLIVRCAARFENGAERIAWGKIDRRAPLSRILAVQRFLEAASRRAQYPLIARVLGSVPSRRLLFYADVPGKSLAEILEQGSVAEREAGIRSTARLLAHLHSVPIRDTNLPSAERVSRKRFSALAMRYKKEIPQFEQWNAIPAITSKGKRAFIHNDFYPGNIIISGGVAQGIDISKGGIGSPLFDVAQFTSAFLLPESIRGGKLKKEERERYVTLFLKTYGAGTGESVSRLRATLLPFVRAVLVERIFDYLLLLARSSSAEQEGYKRKIIDLLAEAERWSSDTVR
jgi:hypothetical protein